MAKNIYDNDGNLVGTIKDDKEIIGEAILHHGEQILVESGCAKVILAPILFFFYFSLVVMLASSPSYFFEDLTKFAALIMSIAISSIAILVYTKFLKLLFEDSGCTSRVLTLMWQIAIIVQILLTIVYSVDAFNLITKESLTVRFAYVAHPQIAGLSTITLWVSLLWFSVKRIEKYSHRFLIFFLFATVSEMLIIWLLASMPKYDLYLTKYLIGSREYATLAEWQVALFVFLGWIEFFAPLLPLIVSSVLVSINRVGGYLQVKSMAALELSILTSLAIAGAVGWYAVTFFPDVLRSIYSFDETMLSVIIYFFLIPLIVAFVAGFTVGIFSIISAKTIQFIFNLRRAV